MVLIEPLQDLTRRSEAEKRGKDEIETILDFAVGIFVDPQEGITLQTNRELQSEFSARLC